MLPARLACNPLLPESVQHSRPSYSQTSLSSNRTIMTVCKH